MDSIQWFGVGLLVVVVAYCLENVFKALTKIMTRKHGGEDKSGSYFYLIAFILLLVFILRFAIDKIQNSPY